MWASILERIPVFREDKIENMPGVGFEPTPPLGDQKTQTLRLKPSLNQLTTLSLAPSTTRPSWHLLTGSSSEMPSNNAAFV